VPDGLTRAPFGSYGVEMSRPAPRDVNELFQSALQALESDGVERRLVRALATVSGPSNAEDEVTGWTVTAIDSSGRASAVAISSVGELGERSSVALPLGYEAFSLPLRVSLGEALVILRAIARDEPFDHLEVLQRLVPNSTEPLYVFGLANQSQVGVGATSGRVVTS